MEKVFVPDRIELERMREYGANIYKYLLVKAIESVIVYGLENPKNDSILESTYKDVRNNFHIVEAVCRLYPEEVLHSNMAADSVSLCLDSIEGENKNNGLDRLSYYTNDVLGNGLVMEKAIMLLEEGLKKNPRYRFEYKDNVLLNKIFNGELSEREFSFIMNKPETFNALYNIEPYYIYALYNEKLDSNFKLNLALNIAINNYASRYGIHSDAFDYYEGVNVFSEDEVLDFDGFKCFPGKEAKKLIKCINRTNKTLIRK